MELSISIYFCEKCTQTFQAAFTYLLLNITEADVILDLICLLTEIMNEITVQDEEANCEDNHPQHPEHRDRPTVAVVVQGTQIM